MFAAEPRFCTVDDRRATFKLRSVPPVVRTQALPPLRKLPPPDLLAGGPGWVSGLGGTSSVMLIQLQLPLPKSLPRPADGPALELTMELPLLLLLMIGSVEADGSGNSAAGSDELRLSAGDASPL